eukprot:1070445-Rhodomonas_salina.1
MHTSYKVVWFRLREHVIARFLLPSLHTAAVRAPARGRKEGAEKADAPAIEAARSERRSMAAAGRAKLVRLS